MNFEHIRDALKNPPLKAILGIIAVSVLFLLVISSPIGSQLAAPIKAGLGKLSAPSGLTASYIPDYLNGVVLLTWTDKSNNEVGFEIARGLKEKGKFDTIGTVPAGQTWFLDEQATEVGTTYYYKVRAFNLNGNKTKTSSYSNISSATVVEIPVSLTISNSNSIPAQNIRVEVPNEPFGGFVFAAQGEPVSVESLSFEVKVLDSSGDRTLSDVVIVDASGGILAGPVDAVVRDGSFFDIHFGSIVLPKGTNEYAIQGTVSSEFQSDEQIQIIVNPSLMWGSVAGQESGTVVSTQNQSIAGNIMTIKTSAVSVRVLTDPFQSESVVAGLSQFPVAQYEFDATQSSENIRFTQAQFSYFTGGAGGDNPENCNAYSTGPLGSILLTDTSVNPSVGGPASGPNIFIFNTNFVVSAGVMRLLEIRCDLPGNMTPGSSFSWGIGEGDVIQGVGMNTGDTVVAALETNSGQTITISQTGILRVTIDPTHSTYRLAIGGTTDVTLSGFRFTALNEDQRIDRVALQLSGDDFQSSIDDVVSFGLYDGAMLVGSGVFGQDRTSVVTLDETVVISKDATKVLTVKGTLGDIGSGVPGTAGLPGTEGALIQIDLDGDNPTTTRTVGQTSGTNINYTGSDTNVLGVRMFNTVPGVEWYGVPTRLLRNGDNTLMRFSVFNQDDDLGVYKITLNTVASSSSLSNLNVFAYTDIGFSIPISGVRTDGGLQLVDITNIVSGDDIDIVIQNGSGVVSPVQVPAGAERFFEVRGTVSGVTDASSITTILKTDGAYPDLNALMGTAADVDAGIHDNFIWSPNGFTTSNPTTIDWTNGYGVGGMPASEPYTIILSNTPDSGGGDPSN